MLGMEKETVRRGARWLLAPALATSLLAPHCGDSSSDPPSAVDAGNDSAPPPPRECNLENVCPNDGAGVFVSPSGSDTNDGTKAKPFKSFARALSKVRASDAGADAATPKVTVFVCEGQYQENVDVQGDVAVYGGFSCADWAFTGAHAVVSGTLPLAVRGAKQASLSDIDFYASPSVARGASSIAGFLSDSTISILRTSFVAAAGKDGDDRSDVPAFNPAVAPVGGAAFGDNPNPLCTTSIGGGGGACGRGAGHPGAPGYAQPAPAGATGDGGNGGVQCGPGTGDGVRGSDGTGGDVGKSADRFGTLKADGWIPESGANGTPGSVGQGGGGGTGPDNACSSPTPPACCSDPGGCFCSKGGAGGAGGCGGGAGVGGGGGGSSIALALFNSRVTIEGSLFTAGAGATGGKGAAGGKGQAGGGVGGICWGGPGGAGGGGGGGGGGTGGLSAGILWYGTPPTLDGQPVQGAASFAGITIGAAGRGGLPGGGGAPGDGGDPRAVGKMAAAGKDGIARAIVGIAANGSVVSIR